MSNDQALEVALKERISKGGFDSFGHRPQYQRHKRRGSVALHRTESDDSACCIKLAQAARQTRNEGVPWRRFRRILGRSKTAICHSKISSVKASRDRSRGSVCGVRELTG